MESKNLALEICEVLSSKKASNIVLIEVAETTTVADYFVIASGRSTTQVKGLYGYVDDKLSKGGLEPRHFEGVQAGNWIALDYGDVVVHIFHEETREFYHLDKLWDTGNNVTKYED